MVSCVVMPATQAKQYQTLREFWPFYLREHSDSINRGFHYVGSTLVLIVIGVAIALGNAWLLLITPLMGYGFAWAGHFFVEKNRPATFTYPVYSLISDWIMYGYWLTGKLTPELEKAGVPVGSRRIATG